MIHLEKVKVKLHNGQTDKEKRYEDCVGFFFQLVNYFGSAIVVIISFFTNIPYVDSNNWNMALYCNDEAFNKVARPISNKISDATIISQVTLVCVFLLIKMFRHGPHLKYFYKILNFFFGLIITKQVVHCLRGIISYPNPSFYQNEQLRRFYCCEGCPKEQPSDNLKKLDIDSRGSFPSSTISAISYCSVFAFLLIWHSDKHQNFATRFLTLLVPGLICTFQGFHLWLNNVNHLIDITFAVGIGSFFGAYMAYELFFNDQNVFTFTDEYFWAVFPRNIPQLESTDSSEQDNDEDARAIPLQNFSADDDAPPPYSQCV